MQNYEDVRIEAVVIDSYGRKLHNVSSLAFKWTVSDSSLGKLSDDSSITTEVNGAKGFQKPVRRKSSSRHHLTQDFFRLKKQNPPFSFPQIIKTFIPEDWRVWSPFLPK